jgi:sarcosine oxidase subunit alpha
MKATNNDRVTLRIDGRAVQVDAGATVAVVLLQQQAGRLSVDGERREALCGMGICWECRARVDAVADVRTCLLPVRDGMEVDTRV